MHLVLPVSPVSGMEPTGVCGIEAIGSSDGENKEGRVVIRVSTASGGRLTQTVEPRIGTKPEGMEQWGITPAHTRERGPGTQNYARQTIQQAIKELQEQTKMLQGRLAEMEGSMTGGQTEGVPYQASLTGDKGSVKESVHSGGVDEAKPYPEARTTQQGEQQEQGKQHQGEQYPTGGEVLLPAEKEMDHRGSAYEEYGYSPRGRDSAVGYTEQDGWYTRNAPSSSPRQIRMQPTQPASPIPETLVGSMKELIATMRLPQSHLPTFHGLNRTEYWEFIRTFQQQVGRAAISEEYKLRTLMNACTASVRDTLQLCNDLEPEEGYKRALAILEERYGDKHHYVGERVASLLKGPVVKAEDEQALRRLADELGSCIASLDKIGMIRELDTIYVRETLSHRLSGRTLTRYEDEAFTFNKRHGYYPGVKWLRGFLLEEANRVGVRKRNKGEVTNDRDNDKTVRERDTQKRAVGLLTQQSGSVMESKESMCRLCNGIHTLPQCRRFRAMKVEERRAVARRFKYCYVCLNDTHIAAECKAKVWCDIEGCQGKHSRWLHVVYTTQRGKDHARNTEGRSDDRKRGIVESGGIARETEYRERQALGTTREAERMETRGKDVQERDRKRLKMEGVDGAQQ